MSNFPDQRSKGKFHADPHRIRAQRPCWEDVEHSARSKGGNIREHGKRAVTVNVAGVVLGNLNGNLGDAPVSYRRPELRVIGVGIVSPRIKDSVFINPSHKRRGNIAHPVPFLFACRDSRYLLGNPRLGSYQISSDYGPNLVCGQGRRQPLI